MKYLFTRNIFSNFLFSDRNDINNTDELLEKIKEIIPRLRAKKRKTYNKKILT